MIDTELVRWADRIFVMEARHRTAIRQRFADALDSKPIVNLAIPDRYRFMDERLIELLENRTAPHLR